jgi:hypothetical protein
MLASWEEIERLFDRTPVRVLTHRSDIRRATRRTPV